MKKIIRILLPIVAVVAVWGCSLDEYPKDAISQDESVRTMTDVAAIRLGNYAMARGFFASGSVLPYELMGDNMNSAMGATNTYGFLMRWSFNSADRDVESVWNSGYNAIANINYFLDRIDEADTEGDQNNVALIAKIKGEVTLLRAMIEHQLLLKFCKSYVQVADPKAEWGIPSMRTYNPGVKPGRNTLYESYDLLLKDIEYAKTALANVPGVMPLTPEVNIDCVYALEAQVRLAMGDWAGSAAAAEEVIGSKTGYSLISDEDTLRTMWAFDGEQPNPDVSVPPAPENPYTEIIFRFYADKEEGNTDYSSRFMGDAPGAAIGTYYNAEFLPTQELIDKYGDNDMRKNIYFMQTTIMQNGVKYPNIWLFSKFPGNRNRRTNPNANNYSNAIIPFRLSDMYLTAAEGYAKSGDEPMARTMLNDLRRSRIVGYTDVSLSGDALMDAIKEERRKEMIMEGTRISDLKRWGDDMVRGQEQTGPGGISITLEDTCGLERYASDYKFVWAIPLSEIKANSAIASQQNEGWQ